MTADVARGFPAFPARTGRAGSWGRSWWARAWVKALEDTSLDEAQLRAGRRYAGSGRVGTITVSPGRLAATVDADDETYEAVVMVDRLGEDDWQRFLDRVAERAGHLAALLDGEMPRDLVDAAASAGVSLLPGIGDLDPSCTCEGWELPCRHAAALCYQLGWLLDADPFVLLLLRGRSRDSLLDELRHRSTGRAGRSAGTAAPSVELGTPAADAYAQRPGTGLPDPPPLPPRPALDDLAVSSAEPPPGCDPWSLPTLVADAAERARTLFVTLTREHP